MGQYTIDDVREQLNGTLEIKDAIMSAINDMGGSVTSDTPFDKYPEAIRNIVLTKQ